MNTKDFIDCSRLILLSIFVSISSVIYAQIECATIADIKKQPAGTSVKYIGTAQTTFYNHTYNGLFMEDETGGILLKGYNQSSKVSDKVKDNMSVTNVIGTWELGDSGKPSGLKVTDKKAAIVSESPFTLTNVTMDEFVANFASYEGKAILITNAKTTKKDNKNYLGDIFFYTNNVSSVAPAVGDFAGCYLGLEYNRFLLCSAELSRVTEFFTFSDMSAYYKGKTIDILDAKVQGSLLVNYVHKIDETKTALFTQYKALAGIANGLVVFVEGGADFQVGDEISGFFGKYTDATKNILDVKNFKGAYFNQNVSVDLKVVSQNNPIEEKADVNISSLISHKASALSYHSQIIVSKYAGKMYLLDDKYYFKVEYKQSNGGDVDGLETIIDSIAVVSLNGLDLSEYVGDNILLRGVYDAAVINEHPTLIVRDSEDFLKTYYSFDNIAEMLAVGQLSSSSIIYELKGEVVVNMKLSQQQGSSNWFFVEDETGVLAVNSSDKKFTEKRKDKIKGIKGVFEMSGKSQPNITLSSDAVIEKVSSDNELNILRASLKEVIIDTMKYAGHIVEIYNVKGDSIQFENHDGSKHWSYFIEEDGYTMNYNFPKTAAEKNNIPDYQTRTVITGLNTIEAFVNYNCLDGGYVIYEIKRTPQDSLIVPDVEPDTNYMDTIYVEFTITTEDLPYKYDTLYYDENTLPGVYVDTIKGTDKEGKECVIIHTLTIEEVSAIEGVNDLDLIMYPSPISANSTLYINADFTVEERSDLRIEIFNSLGQCVYVDTPFIYPIEIDCLSSSGVYIVRVVTGDDKCYRGKIIVK